MDPSTLEREIRRMSERGIYCGNIPAGREDYEAGFMSAMGHCADALKKALASAPVAGTCVNCQHWTGVEANGGRRCDQLFIPTRPTFGCTLYVPASPRTSEAA